MEILELLAEIVKSMVFLIVLLIFVMHTAARGLAKVIADYISKFRPTASITLKKVIED